MTSKFKNKDSFDSTKYRIEQLGELFPEVMADGRINLEALRVLMGGNDSNTISEERFGLYWPGKSDAMIESRRSTSATLLPDYESSVDFDTTNNLFIEGDNLETLKVLQRSYAGTVKLIYLDPPYNTGNDFVYDDNFVESTEKFLKEDGVIDDSGSRLTTNSSSDGRYHTNWLNMMYPRLRMAHTMLKNDGVIMVSIDEHEADRLALVLNEIFGEQNSLQRLVWKKKYTGGKNSNTFADLHEYILVYAKNIKDLGEIVVDRPADELIKFTDSDEYESERGKYYTRPLKSNLDPRPTLVYPIELPDGTFAETQWIVSESTFHKMVADGRIEFKKKRNGTYTVNKKYYANDGSGKVMIPTILDFVSNNDAKEELKNLFNIKQTRDLPFQTPKPTRLLKYLFGAFTEPGDIIMDFFAGSASSGDAVMQLNSEEENRRFILIQLPEPVSQDSNAKKMGFDNIAQIGLTRLRLVSEKLKTTITSGDYGFRVFRLASSNFISWSEEYREDDQGRLAFESENLVAGRSDYDFLFEILVKKGLDLSANIKVNDLDGGHLFTLMRGALFVLVGQNITRNAADFIVDLRKKFENSGEFITSNVVFIDDAFTNVEEKINAESVLLQAGFGDDEIESI